MDKSTANIVSRLLCISLLIYFPFAYSIDIESFYTRVEARNIKRDVSASLSLFSLSVTEELKKKAKYKIQIERSLLGEYIRQESWDLSLNLVSGLDVGEFVYLNSSLGAKYILKRRFKTQKEAIRAKIVNPSKIPLRARDIDFLKVGSQLRVPIEIRFGIKLSPSTYATMHFLKGEVFAIVKGIVDVHIFRESKDVVRLSLIAGTGHEYGSRLVGGFLSPEIVFNVLNYEVDKVWEADLFNWTRKISNIKGTLIDYRINLGSETGRLCYESFFKNYYKLEGPSFSEKITDMRLKSFKTLRDCSLESHDVTRVLDSRMNINKHHERKKVQLGLYKQDANYHQFNLSLDSDKMIENLNFIQKSLKRKNYLPFVKNHTELLFEFVNIQSQKSGESGYQFRYVFNDSKLSKLDMVNGLDFINLLSREVGDPYDLAALKRSIVENKDIDMRLDYRFQLKLKPKSCEIFKSQYYQHFKQLSMKYSELFKKFYKAQGNTMMNTRRIESQINQDGLSFCHLLNNIAVKASLKNLNRSEFFYLLAPSFISKQAKSSVLDIHVNNELRQTRFGDNTHQFSSFDKIKYFDELLGLF